MSQISTRQFIIAFLKRLEEEIPPPPFCHHCITYAQYGSDADGWEEQLAVQVNVGGVFHAFFLSEEDMEFSPERIASVLSQLVKNPSPNSQFSIATGQYIDAEGLTQANPEAVNVD